MKKYIFVILVILSNLFTILAQEYNFGRFNIGADIGWGYRLGEIEMNYNYEKEYVTGSPSGLYVNADATFYFRPKFGLGLKYSFFHASNDLGNIWNKTYVNYIGPAYYGRSNPLGLKQKIHLNYSAGLGYVHYKDDCRGLLESDYIINAIITANTLGLYTDFGAEFRLTPKLFLTGKIHFLISYYKNYTVETPYVWFKEISDKFQNASHLGISFGLKFSL